MGWLYMYVRLVGINQPISRSTVQSTTTITNNVLCYMQASLRSLKHRACTAFGLNEAAYELCDCVKRESLETRLGEMLTHTELKKVQRQEFTLVRELLLTRVAPENPSHGQLAN